MFYIIEAEYVGASPEQMVDEDRIFITTAPALVNTNREPCISGWCGTTNDISIFARGEYGTRAEAEGAISTIFGEVRPSDIDWQPKLAIHHDEDATDHIVAVYRPGAFQALSQSAAEDWVSSAFDQIRADTPDERLDELEDELEADANDQGMTLSRAGLGSMLEDKRDELRERLQEAG